ncbi:hypothetical protein GVAV_002902 [Gurleya vavrai]
MKDLFVLQILISNKDSDVLQIFLKTIPRNITDKSCDEVFDFNSDYSEFFEMEIKKISESENENKNLPQISCFADEHDVYYSFVKYHYEKKVQYHEKLTSELLKSEFFLEKLSFLFIRDYISSFKINFEILKILQPRNKLFTNTTLNEGNEDIKRDFFKILDVYKSLFDEKNNLNHSLNSLKNDYNTGYDEILILELEKSKDLENGIFYSKCEKELVNFLIKYKQLKGYTGKNLSADCNPNAQNNRSSANQEGLSTNEEEFIFDFCCLCFLCCFKAIAD